MSNQNPQPAAAGAADGAAQEEDRKPRFSEVFGDREAAAFLGAYCLSNIGSMLNRVAVTYLVWNQTGSSALAAATFAISFAPYLGLAQVLGAIVDRYAYRSVMIVCDLLRAALVALLLVPGLPVPAMMVIVFAVAAVQPAYNAARVATLAQILTGDRLSVAIALTFSAGATAQIIGYLSGGLLSAVDPHTALAVNAVLFVVSAVAIVGLVRHRPSVNKREERRHVLAETADGLRMLRDNKVLRTVSLGIWGLFALTAVPEGVAVLWAAHLGGDARTQGVIMAVDAVGAVTATLLFTRFVRPSVRDKLIRPLAFLAPAVLAGGLLDPPLAGVLLIAAGAGVANMIMAPMNATLAQCIPDGWRGRVVAAANSGLQLSQGIAIAGVGLVVEFGVPVPYVVGVWGLIGFGFQYLVTRNWPTAAEIAAAKTAAAPAAPATPA
ncbi:MFS transporter [Glycomyces harbinensis]|uniref:Major Facilitator Superfamily protein n=1 Tax=Glycomyces harbinensis TaxID=58114 RepID=A0A1G6SU53_9ACTN|nr:MFS transporter [Glycomyces harbinensis]SDD19737.1 Major Facilitator Superfamily protein [Glycomyces harbinensis]